MQIHGVLLTRNDWGLVAVSIANALNHVDIVHVLNHGSTDLTAKGLVVLKRIWGDRLKIYTASESIDFDQSLLTNIIISIAESQGSSWIYVFDSDEFLINYPGFSLKDELSKVENDVFAIRYRVENYISTHDFDINNLNHYQNLIYKSCPKLNYDFRSAYNEIYKGETSFFDIPFIPKVIFRANLNLLLHDGAHGFKWNLPNQKMINSSKINCAHLTLSSRNLLFRKSAMGESHIKLHRPAKHGWQNQLIHKLELEGRLEWFWERHSIKDGSDKNPNHIIDKTLVKSLENIIDLYIQKFNGANLSLLPETSSINKEENIQFSFDDIFLVSSFFNKKVRFLKYIIDQSRDQINKK
jgi:hypothetical protein